MRRLVRACAAVLASLLAVSGFVAIAAPASAATPADLVINEVEQDGDPDWIELYNSSADPVDAGGLVLRDNQTGTLEGEDLITIPTGTTIAGHGFLAVDTAGMGLGKSGDSARLFLDATATEPIDDYTWTSDAITSWGACPDGSDAFQVTTTVTKGAANDCSTPEPEVGDGAGVEINEVVSNDDVLDDWVELINVGAETVDLSGWVLQDQDLDPAKKVVLAEGTSIGPGGFLAVTVDIAGGFGLGNGDAIHVFLADGATEVDAHGYPSHPATSWGACPDGGDSFILTARPTPGAANACTADPGDSLVVNEVEADDPDGGADWIELYNTAIVPVEASGLVLRDNKDADDHVVIPSGTVIAGNGFYLVETGADGTDTPGLGAGGDAARLFETDGTTLIDGIDWDAEIATTIGRCPDGTGSFATTAAATPGASNSCVLAPGAADLVINEVETNADWVEIANPGDVDVDISGWWIADNGEPEQLGDGYLVPAGGYLVLEKDVDFGFGLGNGDEVRLLYSDGVTEIDAMSYPAATLTSWARCPDSAGDFAESAEASPGTANDCTVDPADVLRINEINSSGTDWVELTNIGDLPVDAATLVIDDESDGGGVVIPADSVIAPGAFVAVDVSGLGDSDAARLLEADATTVIDAFAWTTPADETYGRCPDGIGAFADTDAPTPGAANDCPAPGGFENVVINEVESSGGDPADWIELVNTGDTAVDLSGWIVHDSDDDHTVTIPGGTSIEAGGYLVVVVDVPGGFGLGNDDRARLYLADGVTLVDEQIWGPDHAVTTFGLCPDGIGTLVETFSSTKGARNDCSPVRINEVDSSGATPADWIELANAGDEAVDVTGYVLRDSDDAHEVVLPFGSTIPAGGYLAVDVDVSGGFGLGAADEARLFATDGATLLDETSWAEHAASSWGRCADATGAFEVSAAVTKGGRNACVGILEPEAWPGSGDVTIVDDEGAFGEDLSGLAYEPSATPGERGTLWAVNNGDGTLHRLVWNGTTWQNSPGEWADGAVLRYPDGSGSVDAEGVGFAGTSSGDGLYVASERNNDASGVSRPSVLRYDVASISSGELVATQEWNLSGILPSMGNNTGLEGIAWVPDSFLVGRGFVDQSTSATYDPADYPGHGSGLFFVGVEATGGVYAVALPSGGAASLVATLDSTLGVVADVAFEPSTGQLWAFCDDACQGRAAVFEIAQDGPFAGDFVLVHVYDNPTGMDDGIANEGVAFSTADLCVDGLKPVFSADDSDSGGFSLRETRISCESVTDPGDPGDPGDPATPVAPGEDDLGPGTENEIFGPASTPAGRTIVIEVGTEHSGEEVDVWVFSTPVHLGTFVVPASGRVTVTLPASLPAGAHRIAVVAADGTVLGWYSLTVTPAALGVTGSDSASTLGSAALGSILLGMLALGLSVARRRAGSAAGGQA